MGRAEAAEIIVALDEDRRCQSLGPAPAPIGFDLATSYDNIDVAAATRRQVAVTHVPATPRRPSPRWSSD
jgi:hypothetical protein